MVDLTPKPHSKNRLEQQQLPHIYARHSPLSVSVIFFLVALATIPMGIVVIVSGDRTTELDFRYDHINNYKFVMGGAGEHAVNFTFNGTMFSTGVKTRLMFSLSTSLTPPVYMMYRISPLFQNYRFFTTSVDHEQLRGGTDEVMKECAPFRFPGEVSGVSVAGYYNPCGAYPWFLFNDSISLYTMNGTLICDGGAFTLNGTSLRADNKCVKTGIALPRDVNVRYKPPREIPGQGPMWSAGGDMSATDPFLKQGYYFGEPGHKIPSSLDEDLMVWLDPAFTSDVAKDYRIINVGLPAGDYYFEIIEQFPTSPYATEKFVQLATRSWIGGKNHHLGALLIFIGGVAFITALMLLSAQCFVMPRYTK
ncbi:putative LEM3 (ligand-effect modulator 3) family / CDC50 family [Leishmania utingensis]|uniref:LEM3 (Ligand-effect modulator 3) family / CDC50 family n=1 Tax=Leishmania utingensis TaxID=653362 RepID=A0AAW3A287_9TRYP